MQNALRDDALLGLENKNAVFFTPEEKAQQKAQRNLDAARQSCKATEVRGSHHIIPSMYTLYAPL